MTENEPRELVAIPPEVLGPFMEMTVRAILVASGANAREPTCHTMQEIAATATERARMADHLLSLLDSDQAAEFAQAIGWPSAEALSNFVHHGLPPGTAH